MSLSINIFFINGTEHVFDDVVNYDHDNHAISFTKHQEDGSTSDFTFVIDSIAGFQEIYTQDELEVEPEAEPESASDVASEPASAVSSEPVISVDSDSAVVSEPDIDSAVASSSDVVSEPVSDSAVSSEPTSEEVDSMADAVSQVSQAMANVDNALSGSFRVGADINKNLQSDNAIISESSDDGEAQSEVQSKEQPAVFY